MEIMRDSDWRLWHSPGMVTSTGTTQWMCVRLLSIGGGNVWLNPTQRAIVGAEMLGCTYLVTFSCLLWEHACTCLSVEIRGPLWRDVVSFHCEGLQD